MKFLLGISLISTLILPALGLAYQHKTYDAETFFETISLSGGSISHDDSQLLYSSDESGILNAYSLSFSSGKVKALTTSKKNSIRVVSWFPQDKRFLYQADNEGDELYHLHVREENGQSQDLTPGDNVRASFFGWGQDKERFWVMSNERDPRSNDLYEYSTKNYQRKLIFKNEKYWSISTISANGRWIALRKINSNADSDIYLYDTKNPQAGTQLITTHTAPIKYSSYTFTPDSKKLIYSTNEFGEFHEAWSYDLKTKEHKAFFKADWSIATISYSPNGKYVEIMINQDSEYVTKLFLAQTMQEVTLPDLGPLRVSALKFNQIETKAAFYAKGDTTSSNLYSLDLKTMAYQKHTSTLSKKIDPMVLVEGQVITYPSFDGLAIPSILYQPKLATKDTPVPAIVYVHGGPGGQNSKGYRPVIQFLVNHGYAVLAINNRGSSGYGKSFFHMDDKKHGDVDLKDCVWGRKYLESLSWVNQDKIGIMGGSYGGYLTAAVLTFEPEVFDVGIDIFGVTNWPRTLNSIPPWWETFRASLYSEMGNPAEDEARLRAISPLFHAENISKPLMVIQGANDPRVLKIESDEIVQAARKNGTPVEYVVFEDEGHGFAKKKNSISAAKAYLQFLNTYL